MVYTIFMHPREQKSELRTAITERLARVSSRQRLAEGRSISRRLLSIIPPGNVVSAYIPLQTEADIRPLLLTLLKRGDQVFLPCFDAHRMVLRQCTTLTELSPGALNIPEPPRSAPECPLDTLAIALIPGRAFDRSGRRLGRGSGGFDQWIARQRKINPHTRFIGVCCECQLVQTVPSEPHDEPMDAIATAREIILCPSDQRHHQ